MNSMSARESEACLHGYDERRVRAWTGVHARQRAQESQKRACTVMTNGECAHK